MLRESGGRFNSVPPERLETVTFAPLCLVPFADGAREPQSALYGFSSIHFGYLPY
jgi:hypothetical protein